MSVENYDLKMAELEAGHAKRLLERSLFVLNEYKELSSRGACSADQLDQAQCDADLKELDYRMALLKVQNIDPQQAGKSDYKWVQDETIATIYYLYDFADKHPFQGYIKRGDAPQLYFELADSFEDKTSLVFRLAELPVGAPLLK